MDGTTEPDTEYGGLGGVSNPAPPEGLGPKDIDIQPESGPDDYGGLGGLGLVIFYF